jgi:hypothetical protein
MPKQVEVHLSSVSPYSQSRQHDTPKLNKEGWDDYEKRTWREKCTVNEKGEVVIPAMAFKQSLDAVAKRLGDQIPGKGKNTYTKHFTGGVICEEDVVLVGCNKKDCPSVTINANSDGKRGSGKRVKRTFPQWPVWSGIARFAVLDDTVTSEVFERHIKEAGRFIGVGRFRPENGGMNGRFQCEKFSWTDI